MWSWPGVPRSSRIHIHVLYLGAMPSSWFEEDSLPSRLHFLADEVLLSEYCARSGWKNGVNTPIWSCIHSHGNMSSEIWATNCSSLTIGLYLHMETFASVLDILYSGSSNASGLQDQRKLRRMAEIFYPLHLLPLILTLQYLCFVLGNTV